MRREPVEEFDGGARIGAARVRIADLGGEEFKKAIGRALADGGDKDGGVRVGNRCWRVMHSSIRERGDKTFQIAKLPSRFFCPLDRLVFPKLRITNPNVSAHLLNEIRIIVGLNKHLRSCPTSVID